MPIDVEKKRRRVVFPRRGLFTAAPAPFINENFSPNLGNVRIWRGEVINRPGTSLEPPAMPALTQIMNGGHLHVTTSNASYTLIATQDEIRYFNPLGPSWDDATGAAALTGADTDFWSFADYRDVAVFTNGIDGLWHWQDPTTDLSAGAGKIKQITGVDVPSARYLFPLGDRIIALYTKEGSTFHGMRVRWSAAGLLVPDDWDPDSDPTAGFVDVIDTPGVLTGGAALFGSGFLFKRNSITRMVETGLTSPSFTFQTVSEGIGCIEGRTIIQIGADLFFMGLEDVYRWDVASKPRNIGTSIRDELFDQLLRDEVRRCFAFHHELFNEYWLVVPIVDDTWPTRVYKYNYIEDHWTRDTLEASAFAPFKTVGALEQIDDISTPINDITSPIDSALGGADVLFPLIGQSDNKVYRVDDLANTDNGTAVSSFFEYHDVHLGSPDGETLETVNKVHLLLRNRGSAAITCRLSTDAGQSFSTLGTKTTNNNNAIENLSFSARKTGTRFRVRIETTAPFALLGLAFEYFDRAEFK